MNYQDILKSIGWPETVLVLDFETYFDVNYTLKKSSTVEYIADERFEFTGVGYRILAIDSSSNPIFEPKNYIQNCIKNLQIAFGVNLERCTVVVKNAKFDILVLLEKFGINPPHIIDIEDLTRHYDSNMRHSLAKVAPMFGLKDKGDTNQFKGLHYEDMDSETKVALSSYCSNDVDLETEIFKILLPKVSTPRIEIPLARHTLKLFLEPKIKFDFEKAEELKGKMEQELNRALEKVSWVLKYEN